MTSFLTETPGGEEMFAVSPPAQTLTLTQTSEILQGINNFNIDFGLPKFDPALGKLRSLTLTLVGTATSKVRFTNSSNLFTQTGEAYFDHLLTVLLKTNLLRAEPLLAMNYLTEVELTSVAPKAKKTVSNAGILSASKTVSNGALLNYFMGTGKVRGKLQGSSFSCSDFPASVSSAIAIRVKLSVIYSYRGYPRARQS
ncbi:choice-of-anchor E domain-containing protein [Kovacikia minuta CCNUW1]|uniref:choice-of-anchor E domain-containing protein n=1 Tax=Kovacikia minuta TaxID=2931930 RepID=UPI001CC8EFE7|nr:choice-of-anchor E domain-containing protein [Kovacikia minuta]UBF27224.1 choice-of-anchor E domain-containing protein [Kovacikia minuta CCNUW1]